MLTDAKLIELVGAVMCSDAQHLALVRQAAGRDPIPAAVRDRQRPLIASTIDADPRDMLDEIVAHAQADAPDECCGMIAAADGEATRVYRAANTAHSPLRYEIDGRRSSCASQTAIEDAGWDLGAIYHSHTRSPPLPSQTDINLAFYPDALYVIVGVAGAEPDVRAFRIVDAQVEEVELAVV